MKITDFTTAGIGALLFYCIYGAPSVLGASDFAPLPNQPALTLTNPIILVSPTALNFGSVSVGETVTKDFLVENIGRGTLVGMASVSGSLFKITSDQKYSLKAKQIQVVTVAYTPKRPGANSATVIFTGGGGIKAKVTGKGLPRGE